MFFLQKGQQIKSPYNHRVIKCAINTNMKEWLLYEDAKRYVRRLKLPSYKAFLQHVQENGIPDGIPRNPQRTYGEKYVSDTDFLGTNRSSYLPYYQAKYFARTLRLTSRVKWLEWYRENKPPLIPCMPERVYKEWESWGEFLGSGNIPTKEKVFRSYEESLKYVHQLKLSSNDEWRKWSGSGIRPDDIPSCPDQVYKDKWNGWNEFLGNKLVNRIDGQQLNTRVLFIIQEQGVPSNVFTIGVESNGKSVVLEHQRKKGFRLIKIYKFDPEIKHRVDFVMSKFASPWYGSNIQFLVSNIHELLFELDGVLDWV